MYASAFVPVYFSSCKESGLGTDPLACSGLERLSQGLKLTFSILVQEFGHHNRRPVLTFFVHTYFQIDFLRVEFNAFSDGFFTSSFGKKADSSLEIDVRAIIIELYGAVLRTHHDHAGPVSFVGWLEFKTGVEFHARAY